MTPTTPALAIRSDRPLILYHANCADGFCAAWCAWRKFGDCADYVTVQYGQPPPDVTGRHFVYIVDFSYPATNLKQMAQQARGIIVLDHHASAAKELDWLGRTTDHALKPRDWDEKQPDNPFNIYCRFDLGKSGGRLAWEYFHPGTPAPWLVEYTEDRDLWLWKLPDSREISAFIASFAFEFERWNYWANFSAGIEPGWTDFAEQGRAIMRYQVKIIEQHVAQATLGRIGGHTVPIVNATTLYSEIAGQLAQNNPFGACYFIRSDGVSVFSLRSREGGVDVSEIAKKYGGDGHVHAAGFQVTGNGPYPTPVPQTKE